MRLAVEDAHMDPERAKGFCNERHHAALGFYPATHAAMEKKMTGRSAVTAPAPEYDSDGLDGSWDGDNSDLPDLSGLQMHHFDAAAQAMGMVPPAGDQVSRAAPKLGSGARFKKLKSSLAAKGAHDPGALAAWIGRRKYGRKAFHKLASAARKGGTVTRADLIRFYPLEDIHIVRSSEDAGTDGRSVIAYAAVFGQESEIEDEWGHYLETIDPGAFNRRLDHVKRSKAGLGQIKVLYNHGRTISGTPSERFSMPIGVPADITAESRGLLTRTRYNQTPLADEVLENIRAGSITSQSFVGPMMRCTPMPRRNGRYAPDMSGQLTTVRRMELGLRDYGPVVFPAYSGAEILGVRMSLPGERFAAAEGEFEEYEEALPPDEGPAAGDPLPEGEHSARYHQNALYRLRSQEMREKAGLVW